MILLKGSEDQNTKFAGNQGQVLEVSYENKNFVWN
jgi:hypothetical protein